MGRIQLRKDGEKGQFFWSIFFQLPACLGSFIHSLILLWFMLEPERALSAGINLLLCRTEKAESGEEAIMGP